MNNDRVTVNLQLDKRTKNKNDEHPIKLLIIHNRKSSRYSTNKFSSESEFNSITSKNPRGENREKKIYLEGLISKAYEVINNLQNFSFDNFKNEFFGISKFSNNVYDHYNLKIATLKESFQLKTASSYNTSKNSLKMFSPRLQFQSVTPKFLKNYESYLTNTGKSQTTKSIYLRALRSIINEAIKNGIKMEYPFGTGKYTPPTGENVKKALIKQDVFKIFDYNPQNEQEQWAVDIFNFSYTCNGMNFKDIAYLKYKDFEGDTFKFIRAKTKRTSKTSKEIICSIDADVKDIIKRNGNENKLENYVFKIIKINDTLEQIERKIEQGTANLNKYLKRIAQKVGITQKVTMYAARHSFASVLHTSNTPIGEIKDMLGHTTLAVTMNYLASITTEQVGVNRKKLKNRD